MTDSDIVHQFIAEQAPQLAARAIVDVIWVSPQEIRELNRQHRHIDKTTDVLSFPVYTYQEIEQLQREPTSQPVLLGSLVLCEERIRQYAADAGVKYDERVSWSLRHGTKHLLGYDHDETGENWVPIV